MSNPHQIDWSGIRAAAVVIGVREAARRAAVNLTPKEAIRFTNRVLQRSKREGWLVQKKASLSANLTEQSAKPLSANVITGSEAALSLLDAKQNPKILSLVEKRETLAAIVRTPVGEVDENSPLAQKVKRSSRTDKDGNTYETEEIELPGKLRAIELDARLAGELDSNNGVNGSISLNILTGQAAVQINTKP